MQPSKNTAGDHGRPHGNWLSALCGSPGLSGILFMALFWLVLFGQQMGNLFNALADSDSCWLIKTGVWMLQHQAIPAHNPFAGPDAALAQIPIVCYQWLFEVALGLAHQCLGLQGVVLAVAFCFGLTYLALVMGLYERGYKAVPDILFTVLFSLLALKSYALARPALISLLLMAVLLRLCHKNLSVRQSWVIFPVLFAFWANLHLGFIAGLLVLGLFSLEKSWLGKSWQPLTLWLACGLVTLLNPYGCDLFSYFARLADSPFMNHHIFELGSPAFNAQPLLLAYFLLVLVSAFVAFRDSRIRPAEKALFFISFGLSLYSMRHVFLLALCALPIMASAIGLLRQKLPLSVCLKMFSFEGFVRSAEKPWPWVICTLLLGLWVSYHKLNTPTFPQKAKLSGVIRYLNRHEIPTPLLSNEIWGSYLLYYTQTRSYLDSRMDMYGDDRVQELFTALSLEGDWQSVFAKYRFQSLLLQPGTLQTSYLTDYCKGRVLYRDERAVLIDIRHLAPACRATTKPNS